MAKKAKSLSDQLAALSDLAPNELDSDEEAYDAVDRKHEEHSNDDGEEEARSHARSNYAVVEQSQLRKKAHLMEGLDEDQTKRYTGVKATRREMMDSEEEEEIEQDGGGDDDEGYDDLDDHDEHDYNANGSTDEMSNQDSDEMEQRPSTGARSRKPRVRFQSDAEEQGKARLTAAQSDVQLLQNLRMRTKEDAEKGREVRQQLDVWGKLLGIRIRGQRVVRGACRIPSGAINEIWKLSESKEREACTATLSALDELSSNLFHLQQRLLASFAHTSGAEGDHIAAALDELDSRLERGGYSRKRSYDATDNDSEHLDVLFRLDQAVFEPLWRSVLAKWTSRTSSPLEAGSRKSKFESSLKAIDQSAESQIDRGLSGDAFERLRKRTRVWRGSEHEARIDPRVQYAEGDDTIADDLKRKEQGDPDIFDDSDFYSALLRELIDSRGASSLSGAVEGTESSIACAQAAKTAAKKNRNADLMKTSKGRKLRYDVIEKVEHFMPLVPRETWGKDQIDRLFAQLRQASGRGKENQSSDEQQEGKVVAAEADVVNLGGMRLFG